MAYQKELWTTNESMRIEVEDLLQNIEFLDEGKFEGWYSGREYLRYKLIPELIDQMVKDPANENLIQRLQHIRDLVTDGEIGVAISDEISLGVELYQLFPIRDYANAIMVIITLNRQMWLSQCRKT